MRHSNLQSVPSAEKHVGQITIESPLSCDIFKTSYKGKKRQQTNNYILSRKSHWETD